MVACALCLLVVATVIRADDYRDGYRNDYRDDYSYYRPPTSYYQHYGTPVKGDDGYISLYSRGGRGPYDVRDYPRYNYYDNYRPRYDDYRPRYDYNDYNYNYGRGYNSGRPNYYDDDDRYDDDDYYRSRY